MEFTKQPNRRQTTGTKPPRYSAGATSRPVASSVPTVREAVKSSGKTIKLELSHATKAVIHEAKVLLRLTEEEFGLEENARWQKVRSLLRKISRKVKLPKWPRKVYIIIGCVLLLVLVSSVVYSRLIHTNPTKTAPKSYTSSKLKKGTPNFTTLLPTGKTIEDFGGWTRTGPPTASPVYGYVDKIGDISITVNEQPVPDSLKKAGEIEKLTEAYSHKVAVEGINIYIGTSAKGPDRAIVIKSNLLIIITADGHPTDQEWANYVGSLS